MNKKHSKKLAIFAVIFGLVSFSGYLLADIDYVAGLKRKLDSIHSAFILNKDSPKPNIPEGLTLTDALSACNAALKTATPDKWELSKVTITPYAVDNSLLGPSARSVGEDQVSLSLETHIMVPDTVGSDGTDDVLVIFIYGN